MQSLLYDCTRPGYPPDYLVSRIRGQLGGRVPGMESAQPGDSTFQVDDTLIWNSAAKARRWIYQQMESDLRKTLVPMFVYFEFQNLILCLRSIESHQSGSGMVDLKQSLLAEGLKTIFSSPAASEGAIGKLEKYTRDSALSLEGLAASYEAGGVQGCEEFIRERFFEQVFIVCSHPAVIGLFRQIIDLQNIVTMAKYLRWKVVSAPGLIKGGQIRMRHVDQLPTEAGLEKIVRRFIGGQKVTAAELHPVSLEQRLHDHLLLVITRRMMSHEPVEWCLGYIWYSYADSRKRSEKYHAVRFAENFMTRPEGIR